MSDRASSAEPADGRRSVAGRFSAAAETYEGPADVQRAVAARLLEWLPDPREARSPDRILELGCGTGILTRELAARYPAAGLVATDVSGDMIRVASRLAAPSRPIEWAVADARTLSSTVPFPLVVSSCALHWASPFEETARNIARLLSPRGWLVAALMVDGTLAELRAARLAVAPDAAPRGRLPTDSEVHAALGAAGLAVDRMTCFDLTSRHDSARAFLRSIHEQGVTGGAVSSGPRPLTRRELAGLMEWYDARWPAEGGGVHATYRVCCVRARAEV